MKKLAFKILLLTIIILIVNNIFFSFIKVPFSWGNYYEKEKCLETNVGQYNAILLGSSRVGRQIDPKLFDSLNAATHPTSTINMGIDAMTVPEVYFEFKNIIAQNNPNIKYIFVELCDVDTFAYVNLHTVRKKYYYNYDSYLKSVTTLQQSCYPVARKVAGITFHTLNFIECALKFNELGNILNFKRNEFHANSACNDLYNPLIIRASDTSMVEVNGVKKPNPHAWFLKNTYLLNEVKNTAGRLIKESQEKTGTPSPAYNNMVTNMIEAGKKHSIQVIFILPPKLEEFHYRNVLPVYYNLKPENRIGLADPAVYPEFYDLKYAYDLGHLDSSGSEIYTTKLSEEFLKIVGNK